VRLVTVRLWPFSKNGSHYASGTTLSGTPSAAASLLQRAVPGQSGDTEQIVFQTKTGTVHALAVQKQIQVMLGRVSHLRYVSGVTSSYSPLGAKQISASQRIAYAGGARTLR
jgi:RND superfamily putative drug exporter